MKNAKVMYIQEYKTLRIKGRVHARGRQAHFTQRVKDEVPMMKKLIRNLPVPYPVIDI